MMVPAVSLGDGELMLFNELVNTCLACSCFHLYPPPCSDHNYCDCFCNASLADFEIAKGCSCPCGTKGWPPAYRATWSGGKLRGDRYRYNAGAGIWDYVTFLETDLPSFSTCDDALTIEVPVHLERWTSSGDWDDPNSYTLSESANGFVSIQISNLDVHRQCIDGLEQIVYSILLGGFQIDSAGATFDGAVCALNPSLDNSNVAETYAGDDPCVAGARPAPHTLDTVTPDRHQNALFDGAGGSVGTISWEPACRDCDDVWIGDCSDTNASDCGIETFEGYAFSGEYDAETDEAIYEHFGPGNVGDGLNGDLGSTITATVEASDDDACDDIGCATACPDFPHCESSVPRCWLFDVISSAGWEVKWVACGYCPPAGTRSEAGTPPASGPEYLVDTVPAITHGPDAGFDRFFFEFTYSGAC